MYERLQRLSWSPLFRHWAYRNTGVENATSSADAKTFVWSCLRRGIDTLALPAQRIIFKLTFPEQAPADRMFWVICKPGHPVDVCYVDPGFDVDLFINTSLKTLVFGLFWTLQALDGNRCGPHHIDRQTGIESIYFSLVNLEFLCMPKRSGYFVTRVSYRS